MIGKLVRLLLVWRVLDVESERVWNRLRAHSCLCQSGEGEDERELW